MRVGLLASLLNWEATYRRAGICRYIEALLQHLPLLAPDLDLVAFLSQAVWRQVRNEFPPSISWRVTRWPTAHPVVRIAWEQAVAPLATRDCSVVHGPVNVLPLGLRRPTVVTVHDLAFLHFPEAYPAVKRWYLRLLTQWSVRRAWRVIAVSEQTRQDLLTCYGVNPDRITVVPNGVDPSLRRIDDENELADWRAAHGLPERFLLFVGTLQPRKNLTTLLRALAELRSLFTWPLVVIGARGWKESSIFQQVRALGLEQQVLFLGYVPPEQLPWWYSAATIFVYPSLYEGFGLPVLEAMACGTPVITSNGSALREVAGDAAVLINPYSPSDLARAIRELARNEELQRKLRMAGQARAQSFSWERTARETALVYRAVVSEAREKRRGGEEWRRLG